MKITKDTILVDKNGWTKAGIEWLNIPFKKEDWELPEIKPYKIKETK